jgi:hypothetical protein
MGRECHHPPPHDDTEFERAWQQFRSLLDAEHIDALQPMGPGAVYTALVTVWMLVYQRLHAGVPLADAVSELIQAPPEFLPDKRRVREGTLSANTGSFSRARQRLKPEVTQAIADRVFQSLVATTAPSQEGRRVFLLDGTTITLAPDPALKKAFPPASNQQGTGVWPIAHLVVAHELESGCALLPELGAKFGPAAQSETELARTLMPRLPTESIVIADRNFGIFSVAFAARQSGHDILVRLTQPRFEALKRQAQSCPDNQKASAATSWWLTWKPSRRDRQTNPDLPAESSLEVQLHEQVLASGEKLWLLTSWECPGPRALALYGRRQDVETDIRDVKVTLKTEALSSRSVAMLRKELCISVVAYNLVVQIRRLAARRAGVPPRRLSFSGTWSAVRIVLLSSPHWNAEEWQRRFELALRMAGQRKIPQRPGRNYPRRALPRRKKSTNEQRSPP